jgi:hypothetical protein
MGGNGSAKYFNNLFLMRKIFLLLLFLFLFLPQDAQAKTRRINPVCVASHVNWLSQSDVDRQTTLMQQAGVNWNRMTFTWLDMESQPGVYNFSKYDYIVNSASLHGIKLIAVLPQYEIPSWYRQDILNSMSHPQNPQDYGNFAQILATHFRGKIQLYELGNEPDLSGFWPPVADVASYSALLKAGYTGVKAGDPNAKVISGGLSNVNTIPFVQGMYLNGVKGYFDYFGFHPYSWPRSPDDIINATNFARLNEVRQVMLANGDDKPIMATEVGWPTFTGGVTESLQAQYINRVFQKIEYENFQFVPIACIYDFLDDGNDPLNAEYNFGLLRFDYSPKPSYSTMQKIRQDYNAHFTQVNP